jgi:hypothetical protein
MESKPIIFEIDKKIILFTLKIFPLLLVSCIYLFVLFAEIFIILLDSLIVLINKFNSIDQSNIK